VDAAVGSQDVDEGFGRDDWFSLVVLVGARVVCNKVVEVALDVGYREPIPAIYRRSHRKTEGWIFVAVVVVVEGGREMDGNSGRGYSRWQVDSTTLFDRRTAS